MEGGATIEGLDSALKIMAAAFPKDPEQQRRILNQTMSAAARKTIIPSAKRRAMRGDSSGALSDSIAPRAISKRNAMARGIAAGIQVTPVRKNLKAIAKYIAYHYTRNGKTPPVGLLVHGLSYGHLIEFGTKNASAQPFLWPALQSKKSAYVKRLAMILKKKVELAVCRQAAKAKK